jgi:hypothetical protein
LRRGYSSSLRVAAAGACWPGQRTAAMRLRADLSARDWLRPLLAELSNGTGGTDHIGMQAQ